MNYLVCCNCNSKKTRYEFCNCDNLCILCTACSDKCTNDTCIACKKPYFKVKKDTSSKIETLD